MAKEREIKSRLLKDGNIHYYKSGKRLNESEKKQFFKSQINASGFEPERLSKEDRQLFGRIKGGVAAANKAIRLDNGQIVRGDIGRAAMKLGIDLYEGLKATGFKTLKELEENKPDFFAALDEYLRKGSATNWYNPQNAKDLISDYRGKDVMLNGVKVSKAQAKNAISKFNQELLHALGSGAYQSAIKFTFSGTDQLKFELPDIDDLQDGITIQEFNDEYGDNTTGIYKVFGSKSV